MVLVHAECYAAPVSQKGGGSFFRQIPCNFLPLAIIGSRKNVTNKHVHGHKFSFVSLIHFVFCELKMILFRF